MHHFSSVLKATSMGQSETGPADAGAGRGKDGGWRAVGRAAERRREEGSGPGREAERGKARGEEWREKEGETGGGAPQGGEWEGARRAGGTWGRARDRGEEGGGGPRNPCQLNNLVK